MIYAMARRSEVNTTDDGRLLIERAGKLTRLTLNRPDKRNALSADLVEACFRPSTTASGDSTRLLVLQGDGPGFCAGFDFTGIQDQSDADLVLPFYPRRTAAAGIDLHRCPTLALAHGACFGAGADLVATCSHRVLAPDTTLRMPGLRFDVVLGTRRLADLIGGEAARNLLETSRVFDAEQALHLGFAQQIRSKDRGQRVMEEKRGTHKTLSAGAHRCLQRAGTIAAMPIWQHW